MKKFDKQTAVITGGSKGIGKAAVEHFASHGASVYIWDISEEPKEDIAAYKEKGFDVHFLKVNVSDAQRTAKAAQYIFERHGHIDILINNAGITRDSSFLKMTGNEWEEVINVNLTGVYHCSKAVAPFMVKNEYGRIISTSSIAGVFGNYGQTNYAASKAGVIGMTKTLSRELGKHGITVNAVAPGYILTELTAQIPQKIREKMEAQIPVRRAGTPKDVISVFDFLAARESGFVNGTVVHVDGGMTL